MTFYPTIDIAFGIFSVPALQVFAPPLAVELYKMFAPLDYALANEANTMQPKMEQTICREAFKDKHVESIQVMCNSSTC